MPEGVAVLMNAEVYAGPAALEGLAPNDFTVLCHDAAFADPAGCAAFEAAHPGHVASAAATPEALVEEALARYGRIDAAVGNDIGNSMRGPFEDRSAGDYRAILESYTITPFRLARAVTPAMKARGQGRIVLITSGAPLSPRPGIVLHSAARAATHIMVTALAAELGPAGISVNAIAPIYLLTNLFPGGMEVPAQAEMIRAAVPMQRFGEPSEMAGLVGLLASGRADFISGQIIAFSGGAT
jgi:gluconate 5-dehydrogenase